MLRAAHEINHRAKCLNIVRVKLDFDGRCKKKIHTKYACIRPERIKPKLFSL